MDDSKAERWGPLVMGATLGTLLGACALFQPNTSQPAGPHANPMMYGQASRGASHLAPMNGAVNVAMGFSSLTGDLRGYCIERVETQPSGTDVEELQVRYVEDISSLSKALDISMDASVEFGLGGVSAEAKYIRETANTRNSSFLVIRSVALAPMEALGRYRLTNDAAALLETAPQQFFSRCGDQFVAAIQRDPPLRLPVGTSVKVTIVDQDMSEHDTMGKTTDTVRDRLQHGSWALVGGSLILQGACVE